jgi:hypothetical protein
VPIRGPLGRTLLVLGIVCGGFLAVAGGVVLWGPGLVAVGVAGGVAAALAAGVVRESPPPGRRNVGETAWLSAAWTIGVLLVIAGVAAVAGGVVAAIVAVAGALAGGVVVLLRRQRRRPGGAVRPAAAAGWPPPASAGTTRAMAAPARALPPVVALPTSALGREWLRSTMALNTRLQPAARAAIVRRRQETLDELERRDPDGFARWLMAGPGSDPALFVRGDVRGDQAAGTDAA